LSVANFMARGITFKLSTANFMARDIIFDETELMASCTVSKA